VKKYRVIEHTADIGIEAEADSLEELFEVAAEGMFSFIIDPSLVSEVERRHVEIDAADLEELMFSWLNELAYMLGADGLLLSRFDIERVATTRLEAMVWGEPIDPDRHRDAEEVKAATYHQMAVEKREGTWLARIIFDV
jgi:SHS2 domain-containing protein